MAVQNLGSRGCTLHAANGFLMSDTLQTARWRLNPQTQKKMDHLVGNFGVDVIDELGAVPGDMLHADALVIDELGAVPGDMLHADGLRKTYGQCVRHNFDTTVYMKPVETWGRVSCKIFSGDFYQLPPVPASKSCLTVSMLGPSA